MKKTDWEKYPKIMLKKKILQQKIDKAKIMKSGKYSAKVISVKRKKGRLVFSFKLIDKKYKGKCFDVIV